MNKTINFLNKYTEKKCTMPILRYAAVTPGAVTVTDLVTWITYSDSSCITGEGVVDLSLLKSTLVSSIHISEPQVNPDSPKATPKKTVQLGSIISPVYHPDLSEYPDKPNLTEYHHMASFSMTKAIASKLKLCLKASTKEDYRFNLTGICFDNDTAVCADGYRVHYFTIPHLSAPFEPIVERRTMLAILDAYALAGSMNVMFVRCEKSKTMYVQASGGGYSVTGKIMDAQYPDYKTILEQKTSAKMLVSAKELTRVLKPILSLVSDNDKCATLEIANSSLTIRAEDPTNGNYQNAISATATDALTLGINSKYVLDFIDKLSGEISIEYSNPLSLVKINCENPEIRALIMPIRLK